MLLAQLEDWAEHAFRVAGSQFMARSRIPLPTIQMLGRWGLDGRVTLCARGHTDAARRSRRRPLHPHLLGNESVEAGETLRDQVRKLVAECIQGHGVLVHNVGPGSHTSLAPGIRGPFRPVVSWCGNGATAPVRVCEIRLVARF